MLTLAAIPSAAVAQVVDTGPIKAYARARVAEADGSAQAAASGYRVALAARSNDPVVAIRALRQGLAAGDMALAARAARVLVGADVAPPDADLILLADALAHGRRADADAAVARLERGNLAFIVPTLRAWLAVESGGDPVAILDADRAGAIGTRYARSHRALILIARGKLDDGIQGVRAALLVNAASIELRLAAAAGLAERRREAALALLAGDDAVMTAARERLAAGRSIGPPARTAAQGIAVLMTQIAADVGADRGGAMGVAMGRVARQLDPANARAPLLLARALAGDGHPGMARAVLASIPPDSIVADPSAAWHVELTRQIGDLDRALALAAARAGPGARPEALNSHADLLMAAGRADEAVGVYARLEAALPPGEPTRWQAMLARAAALDAAGRWSEARTVLERARVAAPREALVLNYLGYGQVARRENLEEATRLVAEASRLAPTNAAITDSLGWAHFMAGDAGRALPLLERAARAEPDDAEINDHLGDAYWALGRRYEARYAWLAAALSADDAMKATIAAKIVAGPAPPR